MLHINDLTYRIGERLLIDHATVAIPTGARVGLVGRNGAGKTTLFRIVRGELSPETGAIATLEERPHRLGRAGGAGRRADADRLRARRRRRARARCSTRPRRRDDPAPHRRDPDPARRHRRARRPGARGAHPRRPRLRRGGAEPRAVGVLRRLAHARGAGGGAVLRARPAAARRADQLSRSRRRDVARRLSRRPIRRRSSSSATTATCSTTSPTTSCISTAAS